MPRKAKTYTIAELRQQLAAKEKQLAKLMARRKQLAADLEAVDANIAALGGAPAKAPRKRRKAVKAVRKIKKIKKAPKRKAAREPTRRGRPLTAYVADVLKKAGKAMRVKDVMAAVSKAGYVTKSKDFYGIVATALRDETKFKKISRGVYTLA